MKVASGVREASAGLRRVARVVRRARKKKQISQAELATRVDVTPGTVAGWETARHGIKAGRVNAVARELDVEASELLA